MLRPARWGMAMSYIEFRNVVKEYRTGETAVTEKFAKDTGLGIGDTVRLNTGADSHLTRAAFTITGIAVDPTDVDNPFGSVSYRSAESGMDRAFILPEAEDSDVYTAAVLRIDAPGSMRNWCAASGRISRTR